MKKLLCLLTFLPFAASSQYYISAVAGNGTTGTTGDGGQATAAQLVSPSGLAADAAGNIYISDLNTVRKVSPSGIITTIAGTGVSGYSGDGGPATAAQFYRGMKMVVDATGNLLMADMMNNRVRKISPSGIITTVAGNGSGTPFVPGLQATATSFGNIFSVRLNAAGEMLVSDVGNHRVVKVSTSGIVSVVAGTGVAGNDGEGGPATAAKLNFPVGFEVDATGNMYVSQDETDNIRMINAAGIITTVVGTGVAGFSGDGGPATAAQISNPNGIHIDASGNIYIADQQNFRIRKVMGGIINTIAGSTNGYSGDGGPATAAKMRWPMDIIATPSGDFLIADPEFHVVRRLSTTPPASVAVYKAPSISMYPNPAQNTINISTPIKEDYNITIHNTLGQTVLIQTLQPGTLTLNISTLPTGIYTVKATFKDHAYVTTFVKE